MYLQYRECWFVIVDLSVGELRSKGTRLWTLIAQLASFGVGSMLTWRQWLGGKVTSGGSKTARHMVVAADSVSVQVVGGIIYACG
jgi:hypothetical protein